MIRAAVKLVILCCVHQEYGSAPSRQKNGSICDALISGYQGHWPEISFCLSYSRSCVNCLLRAPKATPYIAADQSLITYTSTPK
eukprot:scaffold197832_cov19-Prasinocladus_malaysianus.AAC.1